MLTILQELFTRWHTRSLNIFVLSYCAQCQLMWCTSLYTAVFHKQDAQLLPRDRATCRVSWNHPKCRTNIPRIASDKSCNRQMTFKVIQGHWKWPLEIDRPYDTSYQWCVVTTCLSCTIPLTLPLFQWNVREATTVKVRSHRYFRTELNSPELNCPIHTTRLNAICPVLSCWRRRWGVNSRRPQISAYRNLKQNMFRTFEDLKI